MAFTPSAPGSTVVSNTRFTLRTSSDGGRLTVQRIRLRGDEIDDALEAARSFMRVTGATAASWWLSEHSTPADVESRLLERGLFIVEGDYLIDGLLLTSPPPAPPSGIDVHVVRDAEEFVAVVGAQDDAFGTPDSERPDRAALVDQYELERGSDAVALFGAWIDGRVAGGARALFSPRGVFMAGGSTLPSARGRGVYRALVRARWDHAVARGTPLLVVQAGRMSAPVLDSLGFVRHGEIRLFADRL
jgi:GNAT superfamily N-acetyltransferase